MGGFSEGFVGFKKCLLAWALIAAPDYGSKEGEEEKGREDLSWAGDSKPKTTAYQNGKGC